MDKPVLLWMDSEPPVRESGFSESIGAKCIVHRIVGTSAIDAKIALIQPNLICFDYDYPQTADLAALSKIKQAWFGIPMILITQALSQTLAVWALRARIWNYLVKPVQPEEIWGPVVRLHRLRQEEERYGPRMMMTLRHRTVDTPRRSNGNGAERAVLKAKLYIEQNLAQRFSATDIARHCNMSLTHFSRTFRTVCQITLGEYTSRARISRAMELLREPGASVIGTAYDVGFQDASYFTCVFRRYIGITPSQYREQHNATARVVGKIPQGEVSDVCRPVESGGR